jgi:uncharacterized membrane protein
MTASRQIQLMRRFIVAPRWLQILIVVVLALGIVFRFINLNGKVYSQQEIYTSLRIAGYATTVQLQQEVFNGRVISKETFTKYQFLFQKNANHTSKSFTQVEAPQYPPFYYLVAQLWTWFFGNSVPAIRILSAVVSLLVFPSLYWLCRELFKVPLSLPGIAIALVAVSPIHLIFAQQAQAHVLWSVTILLSSAALLRALRLESTRQKQQFRIYNWGIYAAVLTIGFYTFISTFFVALSQGIYIIKFARENKIVKFYLLASLTAFLAFLPWLIVILTNLHPFPSSYEFLSPILLIPSLLRQFQNIFCNLNGDDNPFFYLTVLFLIFIISFSINFLYRTTHEKVWFFLIISIVIPVLFWLGLYFLCGLRSLEPVYLLPSYFSVQITVAYLFSTQLYNGVFWRRTIWQSILILVFAIEVISCVVNFQTPTWGSEYFHYGYPQIAKIINQSSYPLLISDNYNDNYEKLLSLSYLLQPKVRLQLVKFKSISKIYPGFKNIFLFNPSPTLKKEIEKKYQSQAKIVYKNQHTSLWKLVKPSIRKNSQSLNTLMEGRIGILGSSLRWSQYLQFRIAK